MTKAKMGYIIGSLRNENIPAIGVKLREELGCEIFDDWLSRAAGIVFVLIVGLVIFNTVSDLPEKYPLFGVFNYSLVPVLFIVGGVIFVLVILKYSDRGDNGKS